VFGDMVAHPGSIRQHIGCGLEAFWNELLQQYPFLCTALIRSAFLVTSMANALAGVCSQHSRDSASFPACSIKMRNCADYAAATKPVPRSGAKGRERLLTRGMTRQAAEKPIV
jgi:hypothetical protein